MGARRRWESWRRCGGREVAGVRKGAPADRKVLVISDSQAVIAAIRKAGRTGRARTAELREGIEGIRERQERQSPDANTCWHPRQRKGGQRGRGARG